MWSDKHRVARCSHVEHHGDCSIEALSGAIFFSHVGLRLAIRCPFWCRTFLYTVWHSSGMCLSRMGSHQLSTKHKWTACCTAINNFQWTPQQQKLPTKPQCTLQMACTQPFKESLPIKQKSITYPPIAMPFLNREILSAVPCIVLSIVYSIE